VVPGHSEHRCWGAGEGRAQPREDALNQSVTLAVFHLFARVRRVAGDDDYPVLDAVADGIHRLSDLTGATEDRIIRGDHNVVPVTADVNIA
jgi:hypothetical protein